MLKLLAMTLHGIALVSLFALEHEVDSRDRLQESWLNTVAAEVCGFLLLLPPRYFRFFHFAHHRHTQDPAHDPELASPKPADWPGYLLHLSGFPIGAREIAVLGEQCAGRKLAGFRAR